MDVDHAGAPILMIRTGDAPVAIGTLTILIIIEDIVGLTATGILTAIVIGDITTETRDDIEPGVGTAAKLFVMRQVDRYLVKDGNETDHHFWA